MAEVLERNQIEEKYQWNLSPLFESDEAWEKALEEIPALLEKAASFEGKLSQSPEELKAYLEAEETLSRKLHNIGCYAHLRASEDTRSEAGQIMTSKSMSLMVKVMQALAFERPEILSMSDEKFKAYLDDYPSDMISKDVAIDELSDALDDVEFEEIDDV